MDTTLKIPNSKYEVTFDNNISAEMNGYNLHLTTNGVPVKTDSTGRKSIQISPTTVDWIETPNGNYQFMNGELIKVPNPGTV